MEKSCIEGDRNVRCSNKQTNKQTPWSESASELYRPSDRRLSTKLLPTFADKGCHVDPVPDPLLFFGSAGNRTRASGSVAKNSGH
jgi:hypothetical protein